MWAPFMDSDNDLLARRIRISLDNYDFNSSRVDPVLATKLNGLTGRIIGSSWNHLVNKRVYEIALDDQDINVKSLRMVRDCFVLLSDCIHEWVDTGMKKTWCKWCNQDAYFHMGNIKE